MRILVLDEEIPYPPNSGKRLRTFNLFRHLASMHEIDWICRRFEDAAYEREAFERLGITTDIVDDVVRKQSGPAFYGSLAANIFSSDPYVVVRHRSEKLRRRVIERLAARRYDLLHCEWTPYAANIPPACCVPTVAMAHNVESLIWKRNFDVEVNPVRRAYIRLQWRKMLRFETTTLPRFTRLVAVSAQEKDTLSSWVGAGKVAVVPNGVDLSYFRRAGHAERPESLVFSGSLDWRPNIDAALHFLNRIWPLIRANWPGATATIVGRNPAPEIRSRASTCAGVRLQGSVDDIRPYLEEASICVVPLRIGGGTRLKILEAFAMERPVVSTAVGAEGLEAEPGRHLLIADDPGDFAAAVGRLFADVNLRRQMGSDSRRLVENRYDWRMLSRDLASVWMEAVATTTNSLG